jgi:hypothetical protein
MIWNGLPTLIERGEAFLILYIVFWMPLFAIFLGLVIWLTIRESRLIGAMLIPEVQRGVLSEEQRLLASHWIKRVIWQWSVLGDTEKFSARRRFMHAVTRLALCNWHIQLAEQAHRDTMSIPRVPDYRTEIEALRNAI